jgi:DNA-binding NarL/FixJ family response regulator
MDNIKGVKLILVDDNIPFRTALKRLLKAQFGCEIIAEASNGEEFLKLPNLGAADIVIMDLMMPKMDGLKATYRINWDYPFLKIIAVTMHCDKVYLKDLIEKGFKGCIFKNNLYDKIHEAIEAVMDEHLYFPDDIKSKP